MMEVMIINNNNNNDINNRNYNNKYDQSSSYKQNTLKRGDHIIPALTIPHHSVYDYDISDNHQVIKLETKNYRTITIGSYDEGYDDVKLCIYFVLCFYFYHHYQNVY